MNGPWSKIDWDQAACQGEDTDEYYPEVVRNMGKMKAICDRCPILTDCAVYAIKHESRGFWGGLRARDRRDIREKYTIPLKEWIYDGLGFTSVTG